MTIENETSPQARMLTFRQAREKLGVSAVWCYEHTEEMDAVKVAGRLCFPEDKLDQWAAAQTSAR